MTEELSDSHESQLDEITDPDQKVELETEVEPLVEPAVTPEPVKVHPLSPNGVRFEQVYAQSKQLKRENDAKAQEIERLKAELEAKKTPESNGETEYSWAQLNEFIAAGRMTLADAQAYRESLLEKKLVAKAQATFQKEASTKDRLNILNSGIAAYAAAIPSLRTETSPERLRVEEEFNWLLDAQGVSLDALSLPNRRALELTALRTVYGSVESLQRRNSVASTTTQQELPGGNPPQRKPNPGQDVLNKLDNRQREYYRSRIQSGMYSGWNEVVAELTFDKNAIVKKK